MFLEAGFAPRSVMELDNVDSAKKMVALELGIAFLPHVAVADDMRSGTCASSSSRPPPVASADRRGAPQGRGVTLGATAAFLELLREMRPGASGRGVGDRVEAPFAGHAFQLRRTAVLEGEPRAGDEISHRL